MTTEKFSELLKEIDEMMGRAKASGYAFMGFLINPAAGEVVSLNSSGVEGNEMLDLVIETAELLKVPEGKVN